MRKSLIFGLLLVAIGLIGLFYRPGGIIRLHGVAGNQAVGWARVTLAKEPKLEVRVNNLPRLEGSAVYRVWLVRSRPHRFFSPGVLVRQKDGSFRLKTPLPKWRRDLADYRRLVVSLEVDETTGPGDQHILEGGAQR